MAIITIGRDPNNQIVINDPHISGSHANVQIDPYGNMTLTDHSSNGTFVNGQLIHNSSTKLQKGDTVLFANIVPLDWNNQSLSSSFSSQMPNYQKVKDKLWSSNGRIRRKTYWLRWLLTTIIITPAYGFGVILLNERDADAYFGFFLLFIYLLGLFFLILQGIKRMHDVDKSGWYILIPFYSLILAFTDGTVGQNRYGEDPKGR
jgi:uncharacterized membrane protein YhaH (DUF805 family)